MRKEIQDLLDHCRYAVIDDEYREIRIHYTLYYAQYLSIEKEWKPLVWSNFFNINGTPYLSALIAASVVNYSKLSSYDDLDTENKYIIEACKNMREIEKEMGFTGVKEFITGICDIQGRPSVDPYHMLYYALKSCDKKDRISAKRSMNNDEENKRYYRQELNEETGEYESRECTKYVG